MMTIKILALCVLFSAVSALASKVLRPFQQKSAVKVISGLQNFDVKNVVDVCWAAENGGATHVDIACDADIVRAAREVCSLPLCVSSVNPAEFKAAIEAGASMLELGNFDSFYEQGISFSAEDVLKMCQETRAMYPDIPLSVTVPHTLGLPEAIELAQNLEAAGADIIQTEGKVGARTKGTKDIQESVEIAAPTLASAYALSRAVGIPVMCASGLNDITVPMAMAAGASGVGVGSLINKLSSRQQMLLATAAIVDSMGLSKGEEQVKEVEMDSLKEATSIKQRSFQNW